MKGSKHGVLAGVPSDLPELTRAVEFQQRAADVGFDWNQLPPVLAKIREELAELETEMNGNGPRERKLDELGDVLFAVANLARKLELDLSRPCAAPTGNSSAASTACRQSWRTRASNPSKPRSKKWMLSGNWRNMTSRDDSSTLKPWWGDFTLAVNTMGCWHVGPLVLWVQRLEGEWRVAWRAGEELMQPVAEVQLPLSIAKPESDMTVSRFSVRETGKPLRLIPTWRTARWWCGRKCRSIFPVVRKSRCLSAPRYG